MYVVSAAQMRELDRLTIREYGTPGHVLMERAGMGAARVLLDFFGDRPPDRAVVVAGKGNNGGDGLVIARVLKRRGIDCQVVLAARKRDVQGDAKRNLQAFTRLRGRVSQVTAEDDLPAVQRRLARAGVIVDALLGTFSSLLGFPASTIAEQNNMVYPVPSSGAMRLYARGYQNLFYFKHLPAELTGSSIVDLVD